MTTSLPTLKTLEAKYKTTRKTQAELRAELNTLLACIFREIETVNFICGYGYTPSFNDGDPCVHCQALSVEGYDLGEVLEQLADEFPPDVDDDTDLEDWAEAHADFVKTYGHKMPVYVPWKEEEQTAEHKRWKRAHTLLRSAGHLFERVYDTNWTLIFYRTGPDTFNVVEGGCSGY